MRVATSARVVGLLLIGVCAPVSANEAARDAPRGWALVGPQLQAYTVRLDATQQHGGGYSALLECSVRDLESFGALQQFFRADNLRGQRVRLRGYLRSRDLELWAGLWMRVDGAEASQLAFDNMWQRPVRGNTEWSQYDIVLDVPEAAVQIAYGVTLAGSGRLWIDDISIEAVDKSVPTTDMGQAPIPGKMQVPNDLASVPQNTGFEE